MNNIIIKTLESELMYNETVILKYKIEYPEMVFGIYEYGQHIFNLYNRKIAYNLEKKCRNELYKEAVELYKYNKENGYPVMVYEIVLDYTITYNRHKIVSLYSDKYMFTGGAHGNTVREAQNWNLLIGKMFGLDYLYPNNPYYVIDILKEINKQIKEQIENGSNQYFDNYCELVLESFKLNNFYMYPKFIEIFFQSYDIAPYSSGIPTFRIKRI